MNVCGDAQLAAAQISLTYVPLNRAHEVAIPLVEWARLSYDRIIASTTQCDRRWRIRALPL